jgi:cyclic pyranopterin phosphate synthase
MDADKPNSPKDILKKFNEKNLPDSFCIVPFTSLILNPSGQVSVCRELGTRHKVGDLSNSSLDDIWNNEKMTKLRSALLKGEECVCSNYQKQRFCNLSVQNNHLFDEVDIKIHQDKRPLKLTANFNGLCNLQCVMCDIWKQENGFYDDYIPSLTKEYFPHLKEIEFLSGEPMIQKDTFLLIDLISKLNPECLFSITTNAQWSFTSRIESAFDKIKFKGFVISIESFAPDLYSDIRKGGKLSKFLKCVENLVKYRDKRLKNNKGDMGITLHFLITTENWKELGYAIDYVDNQKILLDLKLLEGPKSMSLFELSQEEKIAIVSYYIETLSPYHIKRGMRVMMSLIKDFDGVLKAELLLRISKKINS